MEARWLSTLPPASVLCGTEVEQSFKILPKSDCQEKPYVMRIIVPEVRGYVADYYEIWGVAFKIYLQLLSVPRVAAQAAPLRALLTVLHMRLVPF